VNLGVNLGVNLYVDLFTISCYTIDKYECVSFPGVCQFSGSVLGNGDASPAYPKDPLRQLPRCG